MINCGKWFKIWKEYIIGTVINKHISEYYPDLYKNEKGKELTRKKYKTGIRNNTNRTELLERGNRVNNKNRTTETQKSAGHDKLRNEHIKMGGRGWYKIIKHLTDLINKILKRNKIHKDWNFSNIIIIFKKGNRHKIENYRPITQSPTISKIFSKLVEKRIQSI